ncbi:MAG TPA: hypothetical protein VHC72_08795 [Bryobacteraceae bacterium]|nr:hypothetical protein [Bryobacteraceae bacterium]
MCPICRSDHLRIRKSEGFERILIFFTGKRKYFCCDCEHFFRVPDRRRSPRDFGDAIVPDRAATTASQVGRG